MRLQRDEERLTDPRLFRCFGGHVVGGVLPLALFAGGHHHFVSAMAHRLGVQPYSVHTTFQYGGAPGKRHRLREGMLWEEADEGYYAPAGGVLAYDADVPDRLLRPKGGMTAKGHIELMLHQLRQLRVALALSYALGRVLVLPQLACGFDKYWAPIGAHGMIRRRRAGRHQSEAQMALMAALSITCSTRPSSSLSRHGTCGNILSCKTRSYTSNLPPPLRSGQLFNSLQDPAR